ncbi:MULTISPECIES: 2TM domain-containing protein [Chryseobacterium]|uniref:Histidine kinase n=1 Tax=Chryseobacterium cucumeris TaxID=1813611 RepID=A0ABX9XBQ5_9FLAO|nr:MULTISPECIES: 2TM domain-containing protein [Chryseobacterium]MDH5034733.1 2TM domain-containing protein [Chryseobacterium cucumeris]RKE78532.1 2TM domain-containing protein [Chryseobacterium sp. AG363]ROH92920.1 histidine kinase [Chryseobacterium cucumeris]WFB66065.1 2TM domain-containing protein [Chryseobacterium sp. WX]WNI35314.1 2TM domain-containing protein [Chryseobacterium sp. SG20098]
MEILPDKETIAYRKASRRVKDLKEFYGNLTSYCIVIPFLAILNIVTAPGYLWFLWPALGWGVGIAFHAISVFGIGKSWEERKIRELMEKDEKQKIKTL